VIIFRYLVKEVYGTLLATTGVLLLLLISNQFVHYLTQAAAGILPVRTVMQMMSLQVPLLLGLLLPLGLFLGILMAYGRLHADREMVVLAACGFSRTKLLGMTLLFSAVVSVIVGILMLWVEPKMVWYKRHILADAAQSSPLERIFPNQFFSLQGGKLVLYADNLSRNHKHLQGIYLAQRSSANPISWNVINAESGYQMTDPKTQDRFLVFDQGYRYTGVPGQNDFQIVKFKDYGVRIQQNMIPMSNRTDAMSTLQLWRMRHNNLNVIAELQWRISLPLSVIILAILAVPLSQIKPRQGRYAQLAPAIILYIIYADLLFVAQAWLQKGQVPAVLGMWWVHILMLIVASFLLVRYLNWQQMVRVFRLQRSTA
jgi:lipopolysaccharide export system permease protein